MSDSYKVKVNDLLSFDINKESISQLDAVPQTNHLHVLHHKSLIRPQLFRPISIKKNIRSR
jgi:hypothetical protein